MHNAAVRENSGILHKSPAHSLSGWWAGLERNESWGLGIGLYQMRHAGGDSQRRADGSEDGNGNLNDVPNGLSLDLHLINNS